jgi:hypothetical protein
MVFSAADAPDQEEQDHIASWMKHCDNDKSAVEALLNHQHFVYLIGLGNAWLTAER